MTQRGIAPGRFGPGDTLVAVDQVEQDPEWTFLEVVEIPQGGSAREQREEFLSRHPELLNKLDWLRIDLMCGRDGTSALRFWVRNSPPPAPPERYLP